MTTAPVRDPIRSVAVLGAGAVGLSAALAFARALPRARVTAVALPVDSAALADRLPGTLPAAAGFHARIGLTERQLLLAGATHRVGTRYDRWTADGAAFVHAEGEPGPLPHAGAFHQHWLNARRAGRTGPYHRHSAGGVLAEAGKFAPPAGDAGSPLAQFDYALRLDPDRYRDLLMVAVRHAGLPVIAGRLAGVVRRPDGAVETIRLEDGRTLAADLFLDCAGPAAALLSALDDRFEDWGDALPVDRLLLGQAAARPPTSCDAATAVSAGWRWTTSLRDRTLTGFGFASALTDEARARRVFEDPAAALVTLRPGRRPEPWVRNVLAIGDAAVAVDPLANANLHLAQAAILRAIDLLPGRDCHPLELAEYNRRTALHTARVRDFIAAHYLAAPRTTGEFWQAMARRPVPDSLAHTLDQFRHRGRLPYHEEESFDREGWLSVLLGLGIVPEMADPVAGAADPATVAGDLRRLADRMAALPARVPAYPDYLRSVEGRPL